MYQDKISPVRDVFCSEASAGWCSLADAVAHMCPSQRADSEVLDIPSPSPAVVDEYDIDLDSESGWNFSDILPSDKIDINSSLRADFIVIRNMCVKYLVEAPKTAAEVFQLALRGLNTLGEQQELSSSVDRLRGAIWSS